MEQLRGEALKVIPVGTKVCAITGPGQFPEPRGGGMEGTVMGFEKGRFDSVLLIEWSDGVRDTALSVNDPIEALGIGVYAYNPLEEFFS